MGVHEMAGGGVKGQGSFAANLVTRVARLAFISGAVAVTVLCLLPAEALPPIPLWDKFEHAAAYAALAAAGCIGFSARRAQVRVVVLLLMLGVAIEVAQGFVPGRSPSAMDMIANAIGISIGTSIAAAISILVLRPRTASA